MYVQSVKLNGKRYSKSYIMYNFYKRTVTPELVDNGYDWTTSYLEAYTNSYATDPTNINNVFRFSRAWYSELERRNSDPSYEKWRINQAKKEGTTPDPKDLELVKTEKQNAFAISQYTDIGPPANTLLSPSGKPPQFSII